MSPTRCDEAERACCRAPGRYRRTALMACHVAPGTQPAISSGQPTYAVRRDGRRARRSAPPSPHLRNRRGSSEPESRPSPEGPPRQESGRASATSRAASSARSHRSLVREVLHVLKGPLNPAATERWKEVREHQHAASPSPRNRFRAACEQTLKPLPSRKASASVRRDSLVWIVCGRSIASTPSGRRRNSRFVSFARQSDRPRSERALMRGAPGLLGSRCASWNPVPSDHPDDERDPEPDIERGGPQYQSWCSRGGWRARCHGRARRWRDV